MRIASLSTVTVKCNELADSLQKNLTAASNNVVDLTGNLDTVVKRNSGASRLTAGATQPNARSFGVTVDALRGVATTPSVKTDLLATTRDFAVTAKTFAELTQDLRKVTSDRANAERSCATRSLNSTRPRKKSTRSSAAWVERRAFTASIAERRRRRVTCSPALARGRTAGRGRPPLTPGATASPTAAPNSYGVPGGMSNPAPAAVTTMSSRFDAKCQNCGLARALGHVHERPLPTRSARQRAGVRFAPVRQIATSRRY